MINMICLFDLMSLCAMREVLAPQNPLGTTNLNQMRGSSPCVLHEPLLIRIENLQWRGQWRLDTLLPAGKDFDVPLLRILPGCQRPARRTIPTGKLWPKLRGADRVGLDRDRLDATTVCVM
jgi:hypothetical protein